jgi:hypothetical protein
MKLAKGLRDSELEIVDGPLAGATGPADAWTFCPFNSDGQHFGGSYVRKGDKFYWRTDAEYDRLIQLADKQERERAPARELESKLREVQLLIDKIEPLLAQLKQAVQ